MASDLSADSSTHQYREDVTDRLAEDSVRNAVVRRRFGVYDHEPGSRCDRDLAQSRGGLDGERRPDRQEEIALLRGAPRGLQHLWVERLPEGDSGRLEDAPAER